MFQPKFTLSAKLLTNITEIERFYGRLEALRVPQNLQLNLERRNLIRSSYISNSIEGNPLSLPEVTNLLLSSRLPVNRDEKEVKNYFDILKNLDIYLKQPLSLTVVREIHQRLLHGVNDQIAGNIRNTRVVVGRYVRLDGRQKLEVKHEPPWYQKELIEAGIEDLVNWLEADKSVEIIEALKPDIAILDCPSNNTKKYQQYIEQKLKAKVGIRAEHKADQNFPVVSAASILAKVTRDNEIKKIQSKIKEPIGSGYPADPVTVKFLKENYTKYPSIFRHSWDSYKKVVETRKQRSLNDF